MIALAVVLAAAVLRLLWLIVADIRATRIDPVDRHWAAVADWYADRPQDAAERLADEVEHWLCSQTCFPPKQPTEET